MINVDGSMLDFKRHLLLDQALYLKEVNDTLKGQNDPLIRGISNREGYQKGNWGISFVQHCVERVDELGKKLKKDWIPSNLQWTDDMVKLWQNTDRRNKKPRPAPGDIVIMHYVKHNQLVASGQLGIIVGINSDLTVRTLEGSITSHFENEPVYLQVPGIHERLRAFKGTARMKVLGYISPWIDR